MVQKIDVNQFCNETKKGNTGCNGACVIACNGQLTFSSFPQAANQGETLGYIGIACGVPYLSTITFASDGSSTNVGTLTNPTSKCFAAGNSSSTTGYFSGGQSAGSPISNHITGWPHAVGTGASSFDVGDMTRFAGGRGSHQTADDGYLSGGLGPPNEQGKVNCIEKFPFAVVSTNSVEIASLASEAYQHGSHSSSTHGYISFAKNVCKFPFAGPGSQSSVGCIASFCRTGAWSTSETYAYNTGGCWSPSNSVQNSINKFPYSSDVDATDIGNLAQGTRASAGLSSTTDGYNISGAGPVNTGRADIQKYPFASDNNATCVGAAVSNRSMSGNVQI